MRKSLALITTLLICVSAFAQTDSSEFRVKSFRKLDWDVDARVNYPMMDQNNKKAALIKVVTTIPGFDFDVGVMGVVEVKKEIGELWVYVPENVRAITIRHPEFGVIRNYRFEIPIESASVYELTLETPKKEQEKVVIVKDSIVYITLPPEEKTKVKKERKPFEIIAAPYIAYPVCKAFCLAHFGLIAAYGGEKYGVNTKIAIYDTGDWKRIGANIGGNIKCGKRTRFLAGVGYCTEYEYEETDPNSGDFILANGVEMNAGAIMNFGPVAVYAGASTFAFKHYYAEVGVGVRLKMRTGKKK